MVATREALRTESTFSRREDKFFVPPSSTTSFLQYFQSFAARYSLVESIYEANITRTAYYFPGDVVRFPPGFSIRYREYASESLSDLPLGRGSGGCFEVKWTDRSTRTQQKIKLPSQFLPEINKDILLNLLAQSGLQSSAVGSALQWKLEEIPSLPAASLRPLIAVDYRRRRFAADHASSKPTIVNIDTDLQFYTFNSEGKVIPLGDYTGALCEVKESGESSIIKWPLYRLLVGANAERFYGKKGEALNLLHLYQSQGAPPITSEFPDLEIESKITLSGVSGEKLADAFGRIYDMYSQRETAIDFGFTVVPDYRHTSSQTTINEYYQPHEQDGVVIGAKLMIRLNKFKLSSKADRDSTSDLVERSEDKGKYQEYDRGEVKTAREGLAKVGRTIRTRRAFWLLSETNRVYHVSLDFNVELPFSLNHFFSQLEIEYTGVRHDLVRYTDSEITDEDKKACIRAEISRITEFIGQVLNAENIETEPGQRKTQILAG